MAYDSSLDQQLFAKTWNGQGSRLIVGVYSYNNGPKKLQISRELPTEDGKSGFAKLGRLTKEEVQGVLPFLQDALQAM
jgi:hypothetical protein